MRTANPSFARLSNAVITLVTLVFFGLTLRGQEVPVIRVGGVQITGQPEDWTHHHVVFSNPGTEGEAIRNGTHEQWLGIVNDPRYVLHQLRRRLPVEGPAREDVAIRAARMTEARAMPEAPILASAKPASPIQFGSIRANPPRFINRGKPSLKADWSQGILTGTVVPNAYPAKYSFAPIGTPSCGTDYVVYPTGSTGSSSSATIIAYHNLYATTCTGTVPSVYWAYNTGAAAVTTSPVLSLDGTMVAFVQSTSAAASLVVLKFKSSTTETVSAPGTPTTSTNITTCTAPCMTVSAFSIAASDTFSSPYYDYAKDVIYVGDDASHLYKITGVFKGTTTPGFTQITLNTSATVKIYSPVYGATSGCVFVGGGGGFIYSVSSGIPGTVCAGSTYAVFGRTLQLGNGSGNGMNDAALLDPAAGMFYAFITASNLLVGTRSGAGTCGSGQNCVLQYGTSTISNGSTTAPPIDAEGVGSGGQGFDLYAGTFDNVYYSASNAASPSGNIYVVANTSNSGGGTLYRIPIVSNATQSPITIAGTNNTKTVWPSPITEFCNNGINPCVSNGTATTAGTDRIYVSVNQGNVAGTNCVNQTAGQSCVFAVDVTTPLLAGATGKTTGSLPITSQGGNGCWGTGGIIIDNASASTGASQVYFINLNGNFPTGAPNACNPGTNASTIQAVQASQSNLH